MEKVLKVIYENENLKEELKVLLVKYGYYKEARELKDLEKKEIVVEECDHVFMKSNSRWSSEGQMFCIDCGKEN